MKDVDRRYKYLYYVEGGLEQLFDLENDYYDCRDLSDTPEHRAALERARERLKTVLAENKDPNLEAGDLRITEARWPDPSASRNKNDKHVHGGHFPKYKTWHPPLHENYRALYTDYQPGEEPRPPHT